MNEVWDVSLNGSLSDFVHNHMKAFDGFYPQFQWNGDPLPLDFRMWAWSDILERAVIARTLVRDRDVQSFKQREKAILLCRRHVLGTAYDKALKRYYAEMTRRINKRMWRLTLPQTGPTMIGSIDMVWDTGRYFVSVESCLGGEYCWMYKDRDTGSFKSRYNVYLDACVSDITFVLDLVLPVVR